MYFIFAWYILICFNGKWAQLAKSSIDLWHSAAWLNFELEEIPEPQVGCWRHFSEPVRGPKVHAPRITIGGMPASVIPARALLTTTTKINNTAHCFHIIFQELGIFRGIPHKRNVMKQKKPLWMPNYFVWTKKNFVLCCIYVISLVERQNLFTGGSGLLLATFELRKF